jgi:predicted TIM-barrel fold metal-dependent hydrolase
MAGTGGVVSEVAHALAAIKPERLCFGTDYPHEMSRPGDARAYLDGIRDVVRDVSARKNMLGANALALLGRPC